MAQNLDPLALIAKRKAEMEASRAEELAERKRLDDEATARAKEEEEIAIAERVFARLAAQPQTSTAPKITATTTTAPPPKKIPQDHGTPRPKGIPTVPQMVTDLLMEAEKKGLKGLTAPEIMAGIDAKWWPGVAVNLILPTIYRCISKGFWFEKQGKLFVRLRGGQPPSRKPDQLRLDS